MIYTIGETVVDLIFKTMQPQAAKVGGSALNTSVSLGRLGDDVSYISEVGDDDLGNWCIDFLNQNHVGTQYIIRHKDKKTSLALAFLNEHNDAQYSFYKEFSDVMSSVTIPTNSTDILLFSSSFSLNERVRSCLTSVLQRMRKNDALVVYDPNMRRAISNDSTEYSFLQENLRFADIVRLSDEDAQAIFGTNDVSLVYQELAKYDVHVLIYTQNSKDVIVKTPLFTKSYSVPQVAVISTIGAGDTFNAGILHCVKNHGVTCSLVKTLPESFYDEAIPFAIACSGEVCGLLDNYILPRH